MLVIRPIQANDLESLYKLAQESGIGLTSLPTNYELLESRIQASLSAFGNGSDMHAKRSFLFVMEDTSTKQVVGTSGIEAAVGLQDAFYHYHLSKVVHASRELGVHNTVEILTFCNDYTGASEICSLFLRESARKGHAGRLLSKFRFLFMAQHPQLFSDTVIAEMRGISDEHGKSPFWEWLEKHFFSVDFPTADYLTGIGNKVFIAELMPKYPIYVNLLSKEAQACIGKVHEKTKPALRLLEQEGFHCRGYVDIFDGGPTVEADLSNIRTVRKSIKAIVKIDNGLDETLLKESFVINAHFQDFRACFARLKLVNGHTALISEKYGQLLNVNDGDEIRFIYARQK